jgi:hypothetical protein
MKQSILMIPVAAALLFSSVSWADFTSITCNNAYQGVDTLCLHKKDDGSGAYDS